MKCFECGKTGLKSTYKDPRFEGQRIMICRGCYHTFKKKLKSKNVVFLGPRGLLGFAQFNSTWHGKIDVQESSIAGEGPCVWVRGDLSYSNDPEKNPPHFHLSYGDAFQLYAGLDRFLRTVRSGKTYRDAVRRTATEQGEV